MKNAKEYEKKIKKLLSGMGKSRAAAPLDDEQRVPLLIQSVLEEDATKDQAMEAYGALTREFVDFNELRVSPPKEIIERLGKNYPGARAKAEALPGALDAIFDKTSTMTMRYMEKMPKRDLRRHLQEVGLSPYVAAEVVLLGFGGHAVPVSQSLVECLEMEGYVHPGSDVLDVQGFLERIIPQKDAPAAHEFFRDYLKKCHGALTAKRHREAVARAEADRKKAEAEAAAKAEADRKAAEAAAKKALKEAKEAQRQAKTTARKAEQLKKAKKAAKAKNAAAKKARKQAK